MINSLDGSTVADSLFFGQPSVNSIVEATEYTFDFVTDAGSVASLQGLEFLPGKVYTIVLAGVYDEQPGLETFVFEAKP